MKKRNKLSEDILEKLFEKEFYNKKKKSKKKKKQKRDYINEMEND